MKNPQEIINVLRLSNDKFLSIINELSKNNITLQLELERTVAKLELTRAISLFSLIALQLAYVWNN